MNGDLNPLRILEQLDIYQPDSVTPVTGGLASSIWRVEHQGAVYALRVLPAGYDARRELAAIRTAAQGGIPVPDIRQMIVYERRPVMLMRWVAGKPLVKALFEQPQHAPALASAFGQMQAAIHRLPAPPDFDPEGWIEWAGPDEAALKAYLRRLPLRAPVLMHLDYHPLNVMADGGQISAVLDWTNAQIGDPRADLARTYMILRVEVLPPEMDQPDVRQQRRALARGWMRGYLAAGGSADGMAPFYAWAGAVMVRDLSAHIGNSWIEDRHLDPIRRWTAYWKRCLSL